MTPFSPASLLRASSSSSSSSVLKAGQGSSSGGSQQDGSDFGSHLDAASDPAPAPAPAPAAPGAAAKADASDDADSSATATQAASFPSDEAASDAEAAADAAYALAASFLMASLPVPTAPVPVSATPAASTAPAPADPGAPVDPTAMSTFASLTLSTAAAPLPAAATTPAPAPVASDPTAAPAPTPVVSDLTATPAPTLPDPAAAAPANSVLQVQQVQTAMENNAATTVASGINVPSDGTANASAKDEKATNLSPSDAKTKKTAGKTDQTLAASASDALSPHLGTGISDITAMPVMTPIFAAPQKTDAGNFQPVPAKGGTSADLGGILKAAGASDAASASALSSKTAAGSDAASASGSAAPAQLQPVVERTVTQVGNTQFIEVIRQALNDQPLVTPQRISIELQTPPGETVTVFFSQSNGQLRAQLSASDSGSLQWLQQQVDTLKQSATGPSVLWLPPQLDQQNAGQQQGQAHQQQQNRQNPATPPSAEDAALADSLFASIETAATV